MILYIVQRLALLPLLMLIYSFVIFAIIQAPPGDFLSAYVATLASSGSSISADQIAALRHQYGLDQPFVVQYFLWMQNLFHGDFGLSLEYQRPNADLIGEQIGLTIALALFSFVLTWAISVPAGIYSATHPRSLGDHVLTVVNYVGVATPNFMLALILMWVAFAYFDISVTGLYSPEFVDAKWSVARVMDLLGHIWLPALVLGIAGTARLSRIMRANLLDELNKPYVTTARAKGIAERAVITRHVVRNALIPVVTLVALSMPAVFGGAIVTEQIFRIPGIGSLLISSILANDTPVIMAVTFVFACLVILFNLLADILYGWLDPRIAYR